MISDSHFVPTPAWLQRTVSLSPVVYVKTDLGASPFDNNLGGRHCMEACRPLDSGPLKLIRLPSPDVR